MKTWVKLYTEINRNPDAGSLTWAQRGIWSALLALAGEIDDRDADDIETGMLDTVANTAWRIRCDVQEFQQALDAFMAPERRWIEERDGILYIRKYADRQGRAPSERREAVSSRVKRHRQRKSAERNDDVTALHDDVTSAQRAVTPPESESDADTESDTDADAEERADAPATAAAAPPHNTDAGRLFELIKGAGVLLNPASTGEYLSLLDETNDVGLIELCFAEAAETLTTPTPKWLRAVVDRCKRESCLPGQWRQKSPGRHGGNGNGSRASPVIPRQGGPPGSDTEIMPSGLTRLQERMNECALAELKQEAEHEPTTAGSTPG